MNEILKIILKGGRLSASQMQEAFDAILSGAVPPEQTGAFLMGLARRGETPEEIAAAATYLRGKVRMIQAPEGAVDCCGTGGDASGTYNISTAVALVAASCGVPMAKHGNRAASSKSGAADVLEELGVNLEMSVAAQEKALKDLNFAFLMAPAHHQVLKPVAPIRKNLGFRTIFNLLGPLANPAGTQIQLMGVFAPEWLEPLAQALRQLGTKRAWIVHGRDGMDEITLTDKTDVAMLDDAGNITMSVLNPDDFGLPFCSLSDLKGGNAKDNAAALMALLDGQKSPYRDIVLANTAAVLTLHDPDMTLTQAVQKGAEAIDSAAALDVLTQYKERSHG